MDIVRRLVRGVLGTDSRFYKAGSRFLDFLSTIRTDGLNTWRILRELREGRRCDDLLTPVALRNLTHPILIRSGTQDADTVINNVIREEYGQFVPVKNPQWMIDAGAYIGDTAAYFLSRFPDLKIIALEPNPSNHEMASQNLKPYGNRAILLKMGLFSAEQNQYFAGDGTGASIADSGHEIECVTILSLIERYSIPHVDILKMDIEGAEQSIFSSNPEKWLDRTHLLIMEIHGSAIQSLVSRVLHEDGFSMKQYRSIWYCRPKIGRCGRTNTQAQHPHP